MSEAITSIREQLAGLEPTVPNYDFEGLSLPSGLNVDGYFGSHDHMDSLDEVRNTLKQADVIILENAGWDEPTFKLMQKIAAGNYAAYEKMVREIQLNLRGFSSSDTLAPHIRAIYDIKKPLMVIDPPAGHKTIEDIYKHFKTPTKFSSNFEENLEKTKARMTQYGRVTLARENYMVDSFCNQLTETAAADSKFATKLASDEGAQVTMLDFGLVHAGIYLGIQEIARRSGVELGGEAHIDEGPHILMDYKTQASGRFMRGYEVDDLLAAKHVVSAVMTLRLLDETNGQLGTVDQVHAAREAMQQIEGLTVEELGLTYKKITGQV